MRIAAIIVFLALLATPAHAQYGVGTYRLGYLTPTITYPSYRNPVFRPYYRPYYRPRYQNFRRYTPVSGYNFELQQIRFNLEAINDRAILRGW